MEPTYSPTPHNATVCLVDADLSDSARVKLKAYLAKLENWMSTQRQTVAEVESLIGTYQPLPNAEEVAQQREKIVELAPRTADLVRQRRDALEMQMLLTTSLASTTEAPGVKDPGSPLLEEGKKARPPV